MVKEMSSYQKVGSLMNCGIPYGLPGVPAGIIVSAEYISRYVVVLLSMDNR